MKKPKMSEGLKKWLKISAVLYGIFFIGGLVMKEQNLVMYMLLFLAGLAIFVVLQVLKIMALGFKKTVNTTKDLLRTRYVIVFRFS